MDEQEYIIPRSPENTMLIILENAKYCFKILNKVKKITDDYKNKRIDFNECKFQLENIQADNIL